MHALSWSHKPCVENAEVAWKYRGVTKHPRDEETHHGPPAKRAWTLVRLVRFCIKKATPAAGGQVMLGAIEKALAKRGPGCSETAKSPLQVDVTKEPASLAPTVHCNMGGTPTSGKTQAVRNAENTSAPGLAAAGENDGALVHDNNLLGANSLLDLVDVGRQAADTAAGRVILDSPAVQLPKKTGEASTARMDEFRLCKGPTPTADLRRARQVYIKRACPSAPQQ